MEFVNFFVMLTLLTTAVGKTVDFTGRDLQHVPIDSITADAFTVKLSGNKISHLGSFNTTPHIWYLFIDNNRVNNLSPKTFQGMRELHVLNLNRNYIVSLRDFVFSDLAALCDLLLSNNLISAISERAFHGLVSLQFLGLAGNRLSVFPAQAIGLIPSKQLLLVSLMVNNISQIPGDIKSAHPSASYQLQGNPLRCPDQQVVRDDVMMVPNSWPPIQPYVIDTGPEHNSSFVTQVFFIKSRHKYFGVHPITYYVTEHRYIALPLLVSPDPRADHYTWFTPKGSRVVRRLEIESFTAEDSGRYIGEIVSGTKIYRCDLLLCLDRRPKKEQKQSTTIPPSDKVSPRGIENETDICEGSTNKSCCSYWLIFEPSFYQKFCVAASSQEKLTVSFIITIITVVAIVVILFPTALFCWRKRGASRENNRPATGGALNMGPQQAMGVCSPRHMLPEVTEDSTERESDPNTSPLRRLRSRESRWLGMNMGTTASNLHCVSEAPPVDTAGTTEAQVHHYDNVDASDADEEGQHHFVPASPPPLPVREENAARTVGEEASEQPVLQVENAETGEEAVPYGVAAGNLLYQRDSDFNRGTFMTRDHASSTSTAAANPCDIEANGMEESLYTTAEANALYQRETVTTELYGLQTDYANMARSISTTTSHHSEGDFSILYGSGSATVETFSLTGGERWSGQETPECSAVDSRIKRVVIRLSAVQAGESGAAAGQGAPSPACFPQGARSSLCTSLHALMKRGLASVASAASPSKPRLSPGISPHPFAEPVIQLKGKSEAKPADFLPPRLSERSERSTDGIF
uniref:LRRCT domain-containing protein n=1 Tax=Branchiostoma floridae TaxID=7739 RepID=C3ZFF4_BRAFL|eukprot:XP_002592697.1 hypothetical protein BRAFLDRAFT_67136 [Branchiostoma floridae]